MATETAVTDPCFLRSERSPAFAGYCERVYGRMLNQYGTADMSQLDLLLDVLRLDARHRVFDAGCGTGQTTRYLAARSGARFLGVDKAEPAIRRANELAHAAGDGVEFVVQDLDALVPDPAAFDAVVAIESLYFPKDLAATIGQFKAALRPGGQMGFFFTHFGQGVSVPASESKLGLALTANGLSFTAHDLTAGDRAFWQRSRDTAEAMQEASTQRQR
jgi:SAM-dependent methyltransferase